MRLPITPYAADALAAVKAHTEALDAEERGQVLAIAAAADHYRIDLDSMSQYADRLVQGGGDGTPLISEFLSLELGALLGVSPASAASRLHDVLNLRHRHPRLWEAFLSGRVRFWAAATVASAAASADLNHEAALWLDRQVTNALLLQPVGRVLARLDEWILRADPDRAVEKARQAAEARHVTVGTIVDGHTDLWGRLDAADGIVLDDALDLLADQLGLDAPKPQRRAAALGVLARTVFGQDSLPSNGAADDGTTSPGATQEGAADEGPFEEGATAADAASGAGRRWPKRRKADLIIRLSGVDDHVATIEGWGAVPTGHLGAILSGCAVTVRPVVIADDLPAEDGYHIPSDLRLAVTERNPVDVFPHATRRSRLCDLDHTTPFNHQAPPGAGQTRYGNLAPCSRGPHRAKTHGGWLLAQPKPGYLYWTSPGGYEYLAGPHGTILLRCPSRQAACTSDRQAQAPPRETSATATPPRPSGGVNSPIVTSVTPTSPHPSGDVGPPTGSPVDQPRPRRKRAWPRREPSPAEQRADQALNAEPPPF